MNKDTQQKVEEIVERLMKSWSLCDLQYNSEYDKVENELREALTTLLQETEKAERERVRDLLIDIAINNEPLRGTVTSNQILQALTPSK